MLELRDLHKAFGARVVLEGLSARIPTDRVTFVVGRSGQGKSVLCRLAVGLLEPDRGEIQLWEELVTRLPERQLQRLRRRAPYLVQGPALLDWRTVRANVALARKDATAEDVARALARVGLEGVAEQLPPALGPGVKKRVAIARALVLSPQFLLLDEPTTGLDRIAAAQVNDVLLTLKRERLGALVVSHDYDAVRKIADDVLLIAGGRTAFHGPADEFFASSHPEIRALTLRPGEKGTGYFSAVQRAPEK